jgi:hypothetical protein
MRNPLPFHLQVAETAHDSLGSAAVIFDRFVGSWDMDCTFIDTNGVRSITSGEWHFGWILGGRALQDVLYFYAKGERPDDPRDLRGGTTIRVFDSKSNEWLVSWFAALRGEVIHLRGGAEGERIVLRGLDVDGSSLRWSFNDIEGDSFCWLGETSSDRGSTWRTEQEMQLRRRNRIALSS